MSLADVRILDTGALIVLTTKHKPNLRKLLGAAASSGATIFVPAPALVELGQSTKPNAKPLEDVLELSVVASLDQRLSVDVAELLREVRREKCAKCSDLGRPNLVDAVVMALALDHASKKASVTVYTQDEDDLALFDPRRTVTLVRP